jgi:hypothetical protein
VQLFIAKERLLQNIPLPVRARIVNQILDDFAFQNAVCGLKKELYEEVRTALGPELVGKHLNIDVRMIDKVKFNYLLCKHF